MPRRTGDYGGLGAVLDTAAAEQRATDNTPVLACPNDGEPLQRNSRGGLRCPFDGWQPDGQVTG